MVRSQIPNLIPSLSFDHNSCISGLNEHCEGTLSIYHQEISNGILGAQIGVCLPFSTKVLNIRNSRTGATPNMGVHLRIIGLNFLHSPSSLKVCFIIKHTFLASCAFAFHKLLQIQC